MSSLAEFTGLKVALSDALRQGSFHLLAGLDEQIRSASTQVFELMNSERVERDEAISEMREVIALYRHAIDVCEAQSIAAKQEYLNAMNNKQGAARYLQVSGMEYGLSR
ncbi:Hypothetical protein HDN1F_31600 [gamma proteobacterium HdN1]|nr:Hypothetical protein HDN1F_31600 [gamma proteobacterium HdN1]